MLTSVIWEEENRRWRSARLTEIGRPIVCERLQSSVNDSFHYVRIWLTAASLPPEPLLKFWLDVRDSRNYFLHAQVAEGGLFTPAPGKLPLPSSPSSATTLAMYSTITPSDGATPTNATAKRRNLVLLHFL